jgi:ankyrin repeat protein
VYCQLEYICGLIPARIRRALAELPETLDDTYQRTLREINKAQWEVAHRLFQFVAVARRPLRVKELAELLAFDFEAGPIPKFYEDWRLEDSDDAVLSTCSSLLATVDGGRSVGKVVQFAHFSVKEYLMSTRLAEASDIISRRYHISATPSAHTLAAQACLGILLHLDEAVTLDGLREFHFVEYASRYWVDHAQMEGVSQNVEDGMKQLFDPNKPHLAVCISIRNLRNLSPETKPRPERLRGVPLHYAALWGLDSMVGFLAIQHPHHVHSRAFTKCATPLHLASEKGHVEIARFLLDHDANVKAEKIDGSTPLHLASQEGQLEVAGLLIESGADLTAKNKGRETPLHLALRAGRLEVAVMLIERGADVTPQNKNGVTPLHLASQRGVLEVVGMLIDRGADLTAKDKDGETPLHLASRARRLEIAGMLIERGADVTAKDQYGEIPLHMASQEGWLEIAGMLIERGADVTAKNKYRETTPLHLASREGRLEIAGMLIERGADVTAKDKDGVTPLHLASREGRLEIAGMLIERGADVTAKDKDGETPLHWASARYIYSLVNVSPNQCGEVARILLEHGADATVQDRDGRTPFDVASSSRGYAEVAQVLLRHGACQCPGSQENVD